MKHPHIEKRPAVDRTAMRRLEIRPSPSMLRPRAEISCTILTAAAGALPRCPTLAALVPRRVGHLALHPATVARIAQLIPARGLSLGIMIALAAPMPLFAKPATDKAGDAAIDLRQEENWLVAQLRKFRSYPHLHRAYRLLEQDKLGDAAKEIQACLDIDPANTGVRVSYLHVLYRQKRADELLLQAEQVLQQEPANVQGLFYHGLASQMRGNTDAAISSLRRVYENASADEKDREFAAGNTADLAMSQKRYGDALNALTVLSTFQNTYAVHYRQGDALVALSRPDDGARAYETALEKATNQAEQIQALSALGYLAQNKGETDKAIMYGKSILAKDPANINWLRTLSDLYHQKKNYAKSELAARLALNASRASQDRVRLANVLAARSNHAATAGQYAKASFYLKRALQIKRNPEWRLSLAELYAQAGNKTKAGKALAAFSPVSTQDWHRTGEVYWQIGKKETALVALSKGVNSAKARMRLAQRYLDMQRPDGALHELQAALRMEPDTALQIQAQRQIGYIHAQAGRHQQALAAFEAVLEKDGADLAARKEQGFIHMRMQNYPQALECFLHVLEQERTQPNMLAVARVYSAMKQNEPALQYYKMAAADSGLLSKYDAAALHAELGSLYADNSQFADAHASWSTSAGLIDTPEMQMKMAYAEEMRGMAREALARLDAVSRETLDKEQELRLLRQYARLHEKTGNIAQAMTYLERELTLAPSAELHYRIGLYAARLGKNDSALQYLERAVLLEPQNPRYLFQLAYLCKVRGDTVRTVSLLEQVDHLAPGRVSVYQELGHAYSRIGQNDKAIAAFKKAIDGILDARMHSSLRTYFQEPQQQETSKQTAGDEQLHAMRQQVREMSRQFQINAYQSYRSNTRQPNPNTTPGFITGGLVPSQGGIEFLYQPSSIGYQDGKTFRLFGRSLWSNEPHSLRIDSDTIQGGVGAEYKPFRDINAYLSLEKLLKWGSHSENNWLIRTSWGYSDGYGMKPNQRSWNQTIVYADAGYFLQHDKIRSLYAEVRQGLTYNFNNTTMITPHVTAAGWGKRPDPLDASYFELGAGMSVKHLFNETRYETARSSAEFVAQYRKAVTGQHASGWMLTAALQF